MKDLGPLHQFLGISITPSPTSIHLSKQQYILDILSRAGMRDFHPVNTPIDTKAQLSSTAASSEPSNIPLCPVLTFHMMFNKSVYICMIDDPQV
jgi:hypothetical protein